MGGWGAWPWPLVVCDSGQGDDFVLTWGLACRPDATFAKVVCYGADALLGWLDGIPWCGVSGVPSL